MDAIELEFNNSWDVFIERTENIKFVSHSFTIFTKKISIH